MATNLIFWLFLGIIPLAALAWFAHEHWLAPARVERAEIARRVADLRARFAADAVAEAARRERAAWEELDSREQGIWRRVRRRLERER